jgi:hypothetical protein
VVTLTAPALRRELVRSGRVVEALVAHDADKLETLLQAREHEAQGGCDTLRWPDWWPAFGRS